MSKMTIQLHLEALNQLLHFDFFNAIFLLMIKADVTIGKVIALTVWRFVGRVMSLLFTTLSRFVIAFLRLLSRSKRLLISWLQPPSAVILEPKKRKSVTTSTFSLYFCHGVMGLDVMILVFFNTHF